MNNLIRIKQIIDHTTKEPYYPTSHAIAVGYTDKDGECTTVLDALDTLRNAFDNLRDTFNLTIDDTLSLESIRPVLNKVITEVINLLFSCITDRVCYCTPRDVHYIKYSVVDSPNIKGEITYSYI